MADPISPAQKRACLKRELGMRRRVFPGRVASGKMSQREMDHEIAVLEAILADYPEEVEPNLFSTGGALSPTRERRET